MIPPSAVALYLFLGAFTGLVAGYLGIGGGVVLVPILTNLYLSRGMDIDQVMTSAFATSLFTAIFTTGASAWKQWRQRNLILRVVPYCSAGAVVGGQLGAWLGSHVSGPFLMLFFGLFLLIAALNLAMDPPQRPDSEEKEFPVLSLVIIGFITGCVAGLLGVGGGILLVPAFILLFHFTPKKVAGTSSMIAFTISVSSVIGYLLYGGERALDAFGFWGVVDLNAAVPISAGSVMTATIGARLNKKYGGKVYRYVFAVFLAVIAVRMLLNSG